MYSTQKTKSFSRLLAVNFTLFFLILVVFSSCTSHSTAKINDSNTVEKLLTKEAFLADLKIRTFNYFWHVVDSTTWQSDDRYPAKHFTSIAATGFALPSYIIGVENGYITRDLAAERVLNTLKWLINSPQGAENNGDSGYHGFYYHFLNYGTGTRFKDVELSSIDTGLLMAGILTVMSYFDENETTEQEIRKLADELFRRVNWNWMMDEKTTMSMGWKPEAGFIEASWKGYNEAMILLIMALGSPTYPISDNSWDVWTSTYLWEDFEGHEHVNFGPLFGHQYSHAFIDFRGIQDDYMRKKNIDYFENSRRATLSNRAYCIHNPLNFIGYSENIWGLTASDGPGLGWQKWNADSVDFKSYNARGVAANYRQDDGTIAPTAAGGSIPFAPLETTDALYEMYQRFGSEIYREYGFADAFNLSVSEKGWFAPDYIGIDQGALLLQLENHQSELIWNILKKNPYIIKGLQKAGFNGGWLNEINNHNNL
jgi:hypothetical protein